MQAADFTAGERFHFLNHIAFKKDEIFTVEKVEDDYITVQTDNKYRQNAPMTVTNVSLACYGTKDAQYLIEFL